MTSDYNNEEIRESSFPADLKNEPDPIDMYGVWVKSGPHDSESVHPIPEKTENDAASAAADPLPEETFFQEPADIEDIEPEKTFTDNPTADIDTDISFMQEELPPEDISATAETEYSENDLKLDDIAFDDIDAVFTEDNQNGFDSAGDDIADDIETEKLKAETPEPEYPDISDNFESDIIKEEIIQDTDINPLEESYQPQSTKNKAPAVFEFEDIDFDEITSDSDGFINESEQEFLTSEGNSDNGPDEIEFENIRFSDIDGTEDTIISDISEPQDTMIPETTDEKTAAAGTEEENLIQQIGLDEEIDINSFLSDFESEKPSSDNTEKTADVSDSMDLDLDEFIDTFNKSGEIDNSREKDDLFDETEPINLDLEFDEEYIAETEKLRSAGAGSAHSEFFDSEFGVEFVDETGGEEKRDKTPAASETRQEVTVSGLDDFDAMFASIQDESQNIEPAADNIDSVSASIPETEPVFQEEVSDSSGIDATDSYETTEFDDFLSELDNTPSQAVSQNSTEEKTEDKYNLTVTEDVSETSASSQSQILEEENFSVSLFDGDNPSLYEEDKTDSLGNTAGLASLHSEDEENEIDKILADIDFDDAANGETPQDETAAFTEEPLPENFTTEPETTEPVMEEVSFDDFQIDDASSGETPQEETTTFTEEPLPENFTTEPETTETVMEEVSFDDLQIDEAANGETPQEEFSDGPDKKPIDFLENEGYTGGDSNSKDITFDDLEALENDLRSDNLPEDLCAEKDENNGEEMNDKANEILLTIAEELSSIKKEISSLKMDVIQRHQERSSDIPPQQTEASSSSGFFSDDDTDETIALTGDELNNILITADFTEEEVDSGKENTAETEEAASEIPESDNSSELVSMLQEPEEAEEVKGTDIFDLSDEVENNTEDFQKTSLEDFLNVDSDISIPTDEDAENSGIDMDFPNIGGSNVEISHITSLDDETGYLSGSGEVEPDFDDVIMEEPGLESIDFEKEQLQEPELNDFSMNIEDFNKEVESGEDFGGLNLEGLAEDSQNQEENSDLDLTEDLLNDSLEEDGLSVAQEDAVPADTDEIEIPAEPAETVIEPVQENEVQKQDEVPAHISVDTTGSGSSASAINTLPSDLKEEIKSVLSYMDQLLENLPEEKIEEFARSEHFEVYKKLFADLGIS